MTPTMILFAIQATLKLGTAARKGYIDSTRNAKVILPPLATISRVDANAANRFFDEKGKRFLDDKSPVAHPKRKRIRKLKRTLIENGKLPKKEEKELILYRSQCKQILALEAGGPKDWGKDGLSLNKDECTGLVALGIWTWEGREDPEWWMTMAETFFDIGLQYAMADPTICNPDTPKGQALKLYLSELEAIQIANTKPSNIPQVFFKTTLSSVLTVVEKHPELVTGGERGQRLLSAATKALGEDIDKRLEKAGYDSERIDIQEWGNLVFRSLLTSVGRMAVEEPDLYLGIKGEKNEALVTSVGGAILDITLESGQGVDFKKLFDGPGLDTVTRAALSAVAKHPELVCDSDNEGIRGLIKAMATDLANPNIPYSKQGLPEMFRLLLENTSENLELIWPDQSNPAKHLLLKAASRALKALSDNQGGSWQLEFTYADAMDVVESVFDEIKKNPAWLTGDSLFFDAVLDDILDQTILVLRAKGGAEITRNAAKNILSACVAAGLSRYEFTEDTTVDDAVKPFIAAVLETILTEIFQTGDTRIKIQLTRDKALDGILAVVFAQLEKATLKDDTQRQAAIAKIKQGLTDIVKEIQKGKGVNLSMLETAFA